jgi:hypothetical protein
MLYTLKTMHDHPHSGGRRKSIICLENIIFLKKSRNMPFLVGQVWREEARAPFLPRILRIILMCLWFSVVMKPYLKCNFLLVFQSSLYLGRLLSNFQRY